MAYIKLHLGSVDPAISEFIRERVEPYLTDVHAMLRLPLPEHDGLGGCSFSAPLVLFSAVAGLSHHFDHSASGATDRTGELFEAIMLEHYPWRTEPSNAVPKQEAVRTIYEWYRNLLVHGIGVKMSDHDLELKISKVPMQEHEIEQLESSVMRPMMEPTLRKAGGKRVLSVQPLYWGVRQMIVHLAVAQTKPQKFPPTVAMTNPWPVSPSSPIFGRPPFAAVTSTAAYVADDIKHLTRDDKK